MADKSFGVRQINIAGSGTPTVDSSTSLIVNTNGSERVAITSTGNVNITNGNLVFSTSGTGIDFSATADGSGTMTSELLDDYEEGTYTPTDVSGAGLSFSAAGGFYTKIGRLVTCFFYVTFPSTANTSPVAIGSLPFTTGNNVAGGVWTGAVAYNTYGSVALIGPSSATSFNLGIPGGTDITNANMSLKIIRGSFSYHVA